MKRYAFAVIVAVVAAILGSGLAYASCAKDLLKRDRYSLAEVLQCVAAAEESMAEGKQGPVGPKGEKGEKGDTGKSTLPKEAVVAFAGSCPDGWFEYEKAEGRFLVAAGSATDSGGVTRKFVVEQTAGNYEHVLQADEIPPHSHVLFERGGSRVIAANDAGSVTGIMRLVFDRRGRAEPFFKTDVGPGKSKAVDLVPPLIVLAFCQQR